MKIDERALEAAIAASWIPCVYIGVADGREHEISREEIQRRDAEWTALRQASGEDIVIDQVGDHRWQIEEAITAYLAACPTRREQVAKALCALIDLDFDDEDTDQEACLKDTDAFLAVVLPERMAFEEVLEQAIDAAILNQSRIEGTDESMWAFYGFDPEWTATKNAKDALIALVYGEKEGRG